mmetsp:Transcript_48827/g.156977  ORF Transcript_48827/g.156977 Transcript_48827/m.156977 type:complete len:254 (+) Transcript_48827:618-1379(+)
MRARHWDMLELLLGLPRIPLQHGLLEYAIPVPQLSILVPVRSHQHIAFRNVDPIPKYTAVGASIDAVQGATAVAWTSPSAPAAQPMGCGTEAFPKNSSFEGDSTCFKPRGKPNPNFSAQVQNCGKLTKPVLVPSLILQASSKQRVSVSAGSNDWHACRASANSTLERWPVALTSQWQKTSQTLDHPQLLSVSAEPWELGVRCTPMGPVGRRRPPRGGGGGGPRRVGGDGVGEAAGGASADDLGAFGSWSWSSL